ncbi:Spy0128 family protein [uncultured Anaerococcus sp.]|uniref:Spy0128 family protein n=1 Tax=uncultured Anaerococcus sp. TaxID=293428 RepID=UPI00260C6E71|nr:DUF5979 domain-containing protein [uncultured Anaerococcus sp.]
MNLNNIFKKVTGVALAATLSFGAFSGNAFAAATGPINTQGSTEALTEAPSIEKEVTGGYFGGGTFEYEIKADTAPAYTGYQSRTSEQALIGIGDGNIEISEGQTTGSEKITVNQGAVDNALPGVYRYKISEKASGISGMKDDDKVYDVDVFVTSENGTGRKIAYYIVSLNGQKSPLKFTNELSQKTLKITKKIDGNQADLSDTFEFTIALEQADGKKNTSVRLNGNTAIKSGETAVSAGQIGNNGTFEITGLASGDKLTITEKDTANKQGYKANVAYNDGKLENADVTQDGTSVTFTVADNGDITWTNTRTATIPTGLIENIAPFVLAIVAAGVIFLIYFKRDKEEEQYA